MSVSSVTLRVPPFPPRLPCHTTVVAHFNLAVLGRTTVAATVTTGPATSTITRFRHEGRAHRPDAETACLIHRITPTPASSTAAIPTVTAGRHDGSRRLDYRINTKAHLNTKPPDPPDVARERDTAVLPLPPTTSGYRRADDFVDGDVAPDTPQHYQPHVVEPDTVDDNCVKDLWRAGYRLLSRKRSHCGQHCHEAKEQDDRDLLGSPGAHVSPSY